MNASEWRDWLSDEMEDIGLRREMALQDIIVGTSRVRRNQYSEVNEEIDEFLQNLRDRLNAMGEATAGDSVVFQRLSENDRVLQIKSTESAGGDHYSAFRVWSGWTEAENQYKLTINQRLWTGGEQPEQQRCGPKIMAIAPAIVRRAAFGFLTFLVNEFRQEVTPRVQ